MVYTRKRDVLFFGSLAVSVAGQEVYNDDVIAQLARQNAFIKLRTTVTAPFRKTDEVFSAVATSPLYEIQPDEGTGLGSAAAGGASGNANYNSNTNNNNIYANSNNNNNMGSSLTEAPRQLSASMAHRRTPSQSLHRHDAHARHSSQHRQRPAFLPVLLELGRGATLKDVPSIEEMDRELYQQQQPHQHQHQHESSQSNMSANSAAKARSGEESNDELTRVLNSGEANTAGYVSASLRIEVDMSRSGSRTGPVAIHEVFLPSLNYLAQHDICTLVRVPLLTSAIQKQAVQEVDAAVVARESAQLQSSGSLDGPAVNAGVAMNLFVMVRVVSLSEKLRLALAADAQLRGLLNAAAPPIASNAATSAAPVGRVSSTAATTSTTSAAAPCMDHTLRGEAPYGSMPLTELYRHYKRFFEHAYNAVLKHGDAVTQRLVHAPRQREGEASFPYRWNALTEMDLRPLLLGEKNFAPLLLTLAHCTNLRALYAEGNQLGDVTCGRLAALFSRHRYLAYLGLSRNSLHEAGGEQLVHLLKKNLRITQMPCEGNYFSDAMAQRIGETTAKNASVIANDPLNVFAQSYSYLTELSSLPEATQRQALRTWAMLSAAPVGDVDVMVRNLTTSSQRTLGDAPQVAMQRAKYALLARETFSLIPPCATAPLLNEVMRTVYVAVHRMLPDPLVRSLFSDLETIVAQQQAQKEGLNSGGNNSNNSNNIHSCSNSPNGAESNSPGKEGSSSNDKHNSSSGGSSLPWEVKAALGGPAGNSTAFSSSTPCGPPLNAEKLFARSFLRIVVTVFRGLALATPWEEVAVVLAGIGRMHRDLGVMAEDYWLAVHVFMAAVRISCGSESYDADHASSFLAILALAVRTTAGLDVELE